MKALVIDRRPGKNRGRNLWIRELSREEWASLRIGQVVLVMLRDNRGIRVGIGEGRVVSVKRWKRAPDRIWVGVKWGLYLYQSYLCPGDQLFTTRFPGE